MRTRTSSSVVASASLWPLCFSARHTAERSSSSFTLAGTAEAETIAETRERRLCSDGRTSGLQAAAWSMESAAGRANSRFPALMRRRRRRRQRMHRVQKTFRLSFNT